MEHLEMKRDYGDVEGEFPMQRCHLMSSILFC